jgi:hypothetical protein
LLPLDSKEKVSDPESDVAGLRSDHSTGAGYKITSNPSRSS